MSIGRSRNSKSLIAEPRATFDGVKEAKDRQDIIACLADLRDR